MPEQEPQAPEQTPEVAAESSEGGRSLLAKIKIPLLVMTVVMVECGIAYLWLPTVSEAEARDAAEANMAAAEPEEEPEVAQIEVDLGDFNVTAYQPVSSTTLRIDFHLYGVITETDNDEFLAVKEGNDARLREQINEIVRGADVAELTAPELALIKRRILERINRTLGKPLLRGVVFSDFSFIEQ